MHITVKQYISLSFDDTSIMKSTVCISSSTICRSSGLDKENNSSVCSNESNNNVIDDCGRRIRRSLKRRRRSKSLIESVVIITTTVTMLILMMNQFSRFHIVVTSFNSNHYHPANRETFMVPSKQNVIKQQLQQKHHHTLRSSIVAMQRRMTNNDGVVKRTTSLPATKSMNSRGQITEVLQYNKDDIHNISTIVTANNDVIEPKFRSHDDNKLEEDTRMASSNLVHQSIPLPAESNSNDTVIVKEEKEIIASEKYRMLFLLWIIAMLSALDRVAMSVAIVPMSSEFGLSDTMKGSISSLFSVGYGLAIIPAGLVVANVSAKTTLTVGIAVWSVATIVTPQSSELLASTMVPLLLVRAFVGAGESLVLPTAQKLLSVWTTPDQKGSGK